MVKIKKLEKLEKSKLTKKDPKVCKVSLRATKKVVSWLKKNKLSPQKVFDEAVEVLMK